MKKFTIIIPTKNEEGNIDELVFKLEKQYKKFNIVFVDNSTDNTILKIKKQQEKHKNIYFYKYENPGLTGAVIYAILKCKTDFCVIDADMQHDITKIDLIYKEIRKSNYDIVIGNRKKYNKIWHRNLISIITNLFAKQILILTQATPSTNLTTDFMSGFFGMKYNLFLKIYKKNEKRFVKEGIKILFDILKCIKRKDKIKIYNFYYNFKERENGKSKSSIKSFYCLLKSFLT